MPHLHEGKMVVRKYDIRVAHVCVMLTWQHLLCLIKAQIAFVLPLTTLCSTKEFICRLDFTFCGMLSLF